MTLAGRVPGDFEDVRLAKRGVCSRGNGGAHQPLPAAAGGWPTQWDCRIFALSGPSARDGCGAARWLGLDGWGAELSHGFRRAFARLSQGCAGRHILANEDTSDINFTTTRAHSRGPGEIGKGSGRGVLRHAMLGLVAGTGGIPGLATGRVGTRAGCGHGLGLDTDWAWTRTGPGHGLGLDTGRVWTRAGCGHGPGYGSSAEPAVVREGFAAVARDCLTMPESPDSL